MDALAGLNERQTRAATLREGPLLIVAGPGTGKTLTLVRRIAFLLQAGVPPEQILAVTFTNRAGREVRERLHALLGGGAAAVFAGTFHLLGLRILAEARPKGFSLVDRTDQEAILRSLTGGTAAQVRRQASAISRAKNTAETPDRECQALLAAYDAALWRRNACDFDDLLCLPAALLEDPALARVWRERFRYLLVDEYQDISPIQYRLLRLLTGEKNNLCAVGDADQAIYAFRGAHVSHFLRFPEDFTGTAQVALEEHYRCGAAILEAAEALIRHNRERIPRRLRPIRTDGEPVRILSVPNARAEGDAILREIETRLGGTSHARQRRHGIDGDYGGQTYTLSDFAVLVRTRQQARALRERLAEAGIPVQVVGEADPLPRREILALLEGRLADPAGGDLEACLREAWIAAGAPLPDGGLRESLRLAYGHLPFPEAIQGVVQELCLGTALDAYDPRADAVTVATLHAAKGLEFRVVFVAGLEEGLLPFARAGETDREEERRLLYVGMTRAREALFLLYARERFLYGETRTPAPSPFLAELPAEGLQRTVVPDRKRRPPRLPQESLF